MQWVKFFRANLAPVEAYQPGLREEQIREIATTDTIRKLSSNESPFPPFPSALAAMTAELVNLNEYPDGSSHLLAEVLSAHYGVPIEQIILGNGSNDLLDLIAMSCLMPGDNAVYCWPSFVVYRSSAQIAGADFKELQLDDIGSFDLKAALDAIDENTKLVYICSPNNPTGGAVSGQDLQSFLEAVPEHVLVVMDAAYEEFIIDDNAARSMDYYDGIKPYAVLRTFSKMYSLAGIRVGYGFAPVQVVEHVNKVRAPFNVNSIAQAAARASLGDETEIARRKEINAQGRRRLYECFAKLGLDYFESQGNFVWVWVDDAMKTFNDLLVRGVIVRTFAGANGLRVGVGDEAGVSDTIKAFEDIFG